MSSKIFNALIEEKIDIFINAYQNTSRQVFYDEKTGRYIHTGEFGIYRERIVKDFVRAFIPQRFDIGSGFIISANDDVSTQCDLIIYDRDLTPFIKSNENQIFYPVETVVGVCEVKSILSKVEFQKSIHKLSKVKDIKTNIENPSIHKSKKDSFLPYVDFRDSIITFIICEKFDFNIDNIEIEIDSLYDSTTKACNKHNLILSVNDGLLMYEHISESSTFLFYAPILFQPLRPKFLNINKENKYHHFRNSCVWQL